MRLKPLFFLFFTLFIFTSGFASETKVSDTTKKYNISPDDQVLAMIDSLMKKKLYQDYLPKSIDSIAFSSQLISTDSIFTLSDSILSLQLEQLNNNTPINLVYNEYVKAFINLYINKRRSLSSYTLAASSLYYPMIEETLDRFQMPLELKHLAVVESALNPAARSHAGAQGLWQFMYRTGKMYDLQVSSYTDDRMNPYKSTVAACQYMQDLYKMYNDWTLVLAAYNCGPGNVNKAIRRSGGHKDYWKIRAYLPRETRGYVPAFIAVNYYMNYAAEYSIYPNYTKVSPTPVDTLHLKRAMSFNQISTYIDISEAQLKSLNPMYKLAFIPENLSDKTLILPLKKAGLFLVNEEAIYLDMDRILLADSIAGKKEIQQPEMFIHYVRSGEFLGYIANKYRVSVRDLMAWNNLRSSRLDVGDRLKIFSKAPASQTSTVSKEESVEKKLSVAGSPSSAEIKYKLHIVKSGDTLWDIANMYDGISVNELRKLNSNLNFHHLKPGMKVKIKAIG